MKEHVARIQDLIGLLHALYPPQFAESWDNVGLQAGDPLAEITRAVVCLDPSEEALDTALAHQAQAIIAHHPLIHTPLRNVTPLDETGRICFRSVKEGIAVLCAHTNLDRARDGLNDWLATRLGIEGAKPLAGGEGDLVKVVVFVPAGYEGKVAEALFQGGAGHIGNYDGCSFQSSGTGTFRPGAGASPFLGSEGKTERAAEVRLETIVPRERLNRCVDRMLRAHPYEEAAYDLIPLANRRGDIGLGRIGRLPEALSLEAFAQKVKESLGASSIRLVGKGDRMLRKVAVCGGSGASLLGEALRQGADVLVTGDVKYHEARRAEAQGIALIDAGHFATERIMVPHLTAALEGEAQRRRLNITFFEMEGETDPFRAV